MIFKKHKFKTKKNCSACGKQIPLMEEAIAFPLSNGGGDIDIIIAYHYNCFIKNIIRELPELKLINNKKRMEILLENL